ncbi:Tm-1-like ATP-binding domain-containing protein [Georgenia sp. TF02-10]|uniref:Tm-1-like ATP-binding domain-containing protein n=1 Tax=Georgenia sp. TF02-10 TaxID=2917725 RepID=UPI001FA6CDA7|nr:Tm-1-like ATP-binding domain-containing protein [Georgenia sp. TF02-10]UNX54781.1 Tm-1-like ATP-binding domain-containing protein [Georgenia sp. TF02-10]
MATVGLVGTLDTKREEYIWLRDALAERGIETVLIDVGTFSDGVGIADIAAGDVAQAAGADIAGLRDANDRGAAMTTMSRGAAVVVERLHGEGQLHGLLAVGGSGGSSVAGRAMQALPVGVPKLLVTTMAAGDVSPYVGAKDVTIMPSVVDVAGINRISRSILGNAVAAIAAMAEAYAERAAEQEPGDEPHLIGATMFGLTTPAVDEARKRLTELGYEVLVFHATGAGGRGMEALAVDGFLDGVLDLTTTELVDDLLGGVLSAGPDRLEAVGAAGLPQVVSVGALDMCNFGPKETVPEKYAGRAFVVHNPTVTLMRTTAEEMAELGRRIGRKLKAATGPVEVYLPLRGLSGIDVSGGPFFDPEADAACFAALKKELAGSDVVVHELDCAINDPGFGAAAADALHALVRR